MSVPNAPVAIVGMSCLFPRAPGLKGYWRVLRGGVDCISEVPPTHWAADRWYDADPRSPDRTYCKRGGFLDPVAFDPTEFQMPPSSLEATDTSQILGMVVARAALDDAGYGPGRTFDRDRTSVILGVTGCLELVIPLGARLGHPIWREALRASGVADEVAEEVVRRISDAYVPWQENSFPGLLGNVVAGRIANRLDLHGTNCVVDAACASSHGAAHLAIMELLCGRTDMVVTGGVDTFNDVFMFMCFSKTPALSPSGDIRPFSEDADGTLLGEGIGVVVLKRLADAERDGDRIYAVIRGMGTASDGSGQAIYAPVAEGQKRALENAYRVADVDPGTVGLIEAHGTGTRVGDVVEFEALRDVLGGARPGDCGWCALGSVKSQIGHTKAAAGSAGIIKAALALHHKVLPPTLKVERPSPRLDLDASPFYLSSVARPWLSRPGHPRRAGLSAFGFGGSNFHVVLEEYGGARRDPAWDGSVEILAYGAASRPRLADVLRRERDAAAADGSRESLARRAHASRQAFSAAAAARVVLVVEADGDAAEVLDEALARVEGAFSASPRVFPGEGPADGSLAFLFPGQGSQYVGMGRELACVFPEMLDALEAFDAAGGRPLSDVIHPAPGHASEEVLRRTDNAQPALGAVAMGMARLLQRFGLAPELACGHSYGELAALHAAGVLDAEGFARLSFLRGRLMAQAGRDAGDAGTMLAVSAPLAEVERLLAEGLDEVVLANRNSPTQAILSGPSEAVARVGEACRRRGWGVQPLPVAAAFHSPLVAAARAPLRAAIETEAWGSARFPVVACSTARPYPEDAAAARDLLADQLVRPVDFVGQVESLYAAGARTFVEVGPKSVLSRLVRDILGDRPHRACALDASQGRSGLVDLAGVLAQLAASGREVALSQWETAPPPARKLKMEVQLVGANYRSPKSSEHPGLSSATPGNGRARHATDAPEPAAVPNLDAPAAAAPVVAPAALLAAARPGTAVPVSTAPPHLLEEAFQSVQGSLAAIQALQQQTAQVHQRFLEGQELATRTLQQMIDNQHRLVQTMLGLASAPAASAVPWPSATPPEAAAAVPAPMATPTAAAAVPPGAVEAPPLGAAVAVASAASRPAVDPLPVPLAPAPARPDLEEAILALVAEKTGYPREMLHLDMDLESDLGIDSIKRVEILAGMEERIPGAVRVESEQIGSLRTLRQVIDGMRAAPPAAESAPTEPPAAAPADAAEVLLGVVADRTGYPREMLDLDMDLESDLGIDSIKRVEILSAMEERLGGASRIETDRLGSLRTLRHVVEALARGTDGVRAPDPGETARPASPAAVPPEPPAPALERRVLRAVAAPPAAAAPIRLAPGREIRVLDDGVGVARGVVAALAAAGRGARLVGPDDATAPAERPAGGLVVVSPFTTAGAVVSCHAENFLKGAFRLAAALAPELRAAAAEGGALLATVTRMDGAFGLMGGPFDAVQGGLSGLVKTAALEWPGVCCKALDVSADWTDGSAIGEAVVAELAAESPLEVGLDGSLRRHLTAAREPLADAAPFVPLEAGDVVVVTGGARGVTAEAALALARRWRPTLVLLGRSPEPTPEPDWLEGVESDADLKRAILDHQFREQPHAALPELERAFRERRASREILQSLGRLRDTWADVVYRSVDVRDRVALTRVLDEVRAALGPIRGLVHAAGVLADRRLEEKKRSQFDAVFDTKVDGLRHLLEATADDDLRFIALFSSVTARYGRPGQVDYAMANEVLNKVAGQEARRRPATRVVAMNWGPWDGGMVNDGLRREFARLGVGLIPLEAGARALVDELEAGRHEDVEVLIGDGFPEPPLPRNGRSAPHRVPAAEKHVVAEHLLNLDRHPFLRSHCLAGRPVLPLSMIVEWMAHAAMHGNFGTRFHGIDALEVLRGVTLDTPVPPTVALAVSDARLDLDSPPGLLKVDVELRDAGGPLLYARARVVLAEGLPPAPPAAPLDALPEYPLTPAELYDRVLFHGPHFQAITAVLGCGDDGAAARILAAPGPDAWMADPHRTEWLADPLLLDGGLQLGVIWCRERLGYPGLPTRAGRYRQYVARLTREGVTAWLRVRHHQPRTLLADLDFVAEDGSALARWEGVEWTADASLESAFRAVAAGSRR